MKILISRICGFVGSTLAAALREADPALKVAGFDNFVRPGSELATVLEEIAEHAETHPEWLELSRA
jgi:nucleoside-diphosphate-sugar epimerase